MRRCEVVLMDQGNFLCFLVPYPQGLYNRRQNWQGQHNRIIVMVEYSVEYSVLPIPKSYLYQTPIAMQNEEFIAN